MSTPDYQKFEDARYKLCLRNKDDLESLDLIAEMHEVFLDLQENYENLDPRGEK